jgi:hypothetical protein
MQRSAIVMAIVLCAPALAAFWLAAPAEADDAMVATAIIKLTAYASREWTLVPMIGTGQPGRCSQGEVQRFAKDGTLTIERCVAGKVKRTSHRWTITQAGAQETMLVVDDGPPVELRFEQEGKAHVMRLRNRSGAKPADRELRLTEH